jgi:hypothetical protein
MPTTSRGLPYPSPTVPPNVPVDVQALAEAVERLDPVAKGSVTLPGLSVAVQTVAVTFPVGRFTTAPEVALGIQGSDPTTRSCCLFTTPSTGGVSIAGKATTAGPGSYLVRWIAAG